ncbi:hypothetical protein [Xanthomonas theicola]|uniref:hypothetical protein n=1 Tax=Xanthomonas theicola TaxID=56464 RepID=UPI0014766F20|nr:hypothetical protein [Xanthomonas theicola]QNH23484.1 hypothetical protein G4Q83_07670 [Xanthomonas theicola]
MNELIELGMVAGESSAHDQAGLDGSDLVELGSVVSETKAHNHGTFLEASFIATTSP